MILLLIHRTRASTVPCHARRFDSRRERQLMTYPGWSGPFLGLSYDAGSSPAQATAQQDGLIVSQSQTRGGSGSVVTIVSFTATSVPAFSNKTTVTLTRLSTVTVTGNSKGLSPGFSSASGMTAESVAENGAGKVRLFRLAPLCRLFPFSRPAAKPAYRPSRAARLRLYSAPATCLPRQWP